MNEITRSYTACIIVAMYSMSTLVAAVSSDRDTLRGRVAGGYHVGNRHERMDKDTTERTEKDGSNGSVTITIIVFSMFFLVVLFYGRNKVAACMKWLSEQQYCRWKRQFVDHVKGFVDQSKGVYNDWKLERRRRSAVVAVSGPFPLLYAETAPEDITRDIILLESGSSVIEDRIPVANRVGEGEPDCQTTRFVGVALLRPNAIPIEDLG